MVGTVIMDLSKAFDLIPDDLLLKLTEELFNKLQATGPSGGRYK